MNKTERFFEKMKNSKVAFIGIGVSHTDLRVEFYSNMRTPNFRAMPKRCQEIYNDPAITRPSGWSA